MIYEHLEKMYQHEIQRKKDKALLDKPNILLKRIQGNFDDIIKQLKTKSDGKRISKKIEEQGGLQTLNSINSQVSAVRNQVNGYLGTTIKQKKSSKSKSSNRKKSSKSKSSKSKSSKSKSSNRKKSSKGRP